MPQRPVAVDVLETPRERSNCLPFAGTSNRVATDTQMPKAQKNITIPVPS